MRMIVPIVFAACSSAALASGAGAQTATPAPSPPHGAGVNAADVARSKPEIDRLDGLWKTGGQASWFADSFLATIPFTSVAPILDQVRTALGAYRATAGADGNYVSSFERGTDQVRIHLDPSGKIDGLFLSPPQLTPVAIASASADLGHQRIDAMFSSGVRAEWFSDAFLAKLPLEKLADILSAVEGGLGAYRSTAGANGDYVSTFERGTERVQLHLDANNKIDSFSVFAPHVTTTPTP